MVLRLGWCLARYRLLAVSYRNSFEPAECGGYGPGNDKFLFLCQPYREIFEFFIEDFKTYKPLLSSIKNAYEVMLGKTAAPFRTPAGMNAEYPSLIF